MSYYTTYNLCVQNIDRNDYDLLIKLLKQMKIIGYALGDIDSFNEYNEDARQAYIDTNGDSTWDDHDAEMAAVSLEFPEARFCLRGWGDDRDDTWKHYFQNGEHEFCGVEIIEQQPKKILWEKEVI